MGRVFGAVLFEVATVLGTAGAGAALKGRLAARMADFDVPGLPASLSRRLRAAASEAVEDVGKKGETRLGPPRSPLIPGSAEHKAQRWHDYQNRRGTWSYDRWSTIPAIAALTSDASVDFLTWTRGCGLFFCFPAMRRLAQCEHHDLLARDGADIVMHTQDLHAGNDLNHRVNLGSSGFK